MASGPRPTARPGAGPGRGRSRTRTATRRPAVKTPASPPSADEVTEESIPIDAPLDPRTEAKRQRRSSVTTRAIALGVVLLILTISYASSLRIYFAQRADIASTKQEIAQREQAIADLESEVTRWKDPAYVKAQARDRLGWVVPGETGYKVIGPDGKPIAGGAEIDNPKAVKSEEPDPAWWQDLWGSVETADDPTPQPTATPTPSKDPTITVGSRPR